MLHLLVRVTQRTSKQIEGKKTQITLRLYPETFIRLAPTL